MNFMGSIISEQFCIVAAIVYMGVYTIYSMHESLTVGLAKNVITDYIGFLLAVFVIALSTGVFHHSDLPFPLLVLICSCLASWNYGLVNWPLLWPRFAKRLHVRGDPMEIVLFTGIVSTLFSMLVLREVMVG